MPNSTRAPKTRKQVRPYSDFPLTPRDDGRWCKRIRGKLHLFSGAWQEAKEEYDRVKDYLAKGLAPPPKAAADALTVAGLVNHLLTYKQSLVDSGEITRRTFAEWHSICGLVVECLGRDRAAEEIGPEDFQNLRATMAKRWGAKRLGIQVMNVRSIFRYGFDMGLLAKPVKFGPAFARPAEKVLRKDRQQRGPREFTPEQIHAILAVASPVMKAATLLGINAAMGAADLAALPIAAVNLDTGWVVWPRVKTAVERKVPLWPETIAAIRELLTIRRQTRNEAHRGLLFVSRQGLAYLRQKSSNLDGMDEPWKYERSDALSSEFGRCLKRAGIVGRAHYDLRRTFQTQAEACHDMAAVAAVMGHSPHKNDMASNYRQRMDDSRLLAAVNVVRNWLLPTPTKAKPPAKRKAKTQEQPQLKIVG